jgi:ferrochelatase
LVLNLFILPFRPQRSAAAYRLIWTENGSPLLFHGRALVERLRERFGPNVQIELAMRYQNPSIAATLEKFITDGVDRLVVFPLFPQYSSAAWGSAVEKLFDEAGKRWNVPSIQVVPPFYDQPGFLDAWAEATDAVRREMQPDFYLMSFHGLPERHVTKSDESCGRHCLQSEDCCERIVRANRNCYRAQCFATAHGIAKRLEIGRDQYEVTFQSRLGREPWIQPYTDEVIPKLAQRGVKRLIVLSPAFVADCLETIEEIGIRAKESFEESGGEELRLVPSLNSAEPWIDAAERILRHGTALGELEVA